MTVISGRLSELALVRMHGRADEYLTAPDEERAAIVAACRAEATVPDLAERILSRTIYAQASSRTGPIRELLQNALDASSRGGRIDVRSADPVPGQMTSLTADAASRDREITVTDRGRGMGRAELLRDLLVPFRSGKEGDPDAIGEHGIGFLSALEIAPSIEVTTATAREAQRLRIRPLGARAPYPDFTWTLHPVHPASAPGIGTVVRLELEQPIDRGALVAEVTAAAGLVDPSRARIFVNGALINRARSRMRRVARATVGSFGELELFLGRGEGIPPRLLVTQQGLLVAVRHDGWSGGRSATSRPSFSFAESSLHRDLAQAITAAGYGLVADLPASVPLTKGRSAAAAIASQDVEDAITTAFERFILEDALYDRELLRGVDHRLSSVLDRLLSASIMGEVAPSAPPSSPPPSPPPSPLPSPPPMESTPSSPPGGARAAALPAPDAPPPPTVAAPAEVVRFAGALLDAPMFLVSTFEPIAPGCPLPARCREVSSFRPLRALLKAHREGRLRPAGESADPDRVYLTLADPLSQALFRRLSMLGALAPADRPRKINAAALPCVSREQLLDASADVPGVRALVAVMTVLERIDAAISAAADLAPSAISVHQDLYGPDEMAHTDGAGISLNLSSLRIRALLSALLGGDDPVAFGAIVDLLLHEKSHVSLASYVPRMAAEHGASFYRKKDWLRRRFLSAIACGEIPDPMTLLAVVRRGLPDAVLPSPEELALAMSPKEPVVTRGDRS